MAADKRTQHKKRRDAKRDPVTGKSEYEKVMSGEIEPTGCQKGWKNLRPVPFDQMTEEQALEIRRKGAAAVREIRGEKKTAKQVLENLLTLKATDELIDSADLTPELIERLKKGAKGATLYDLVGAVALGKALDGNIKAAEYIRDTYGDKPVDKVEVQADIMTDTDRAMLQKISARLDDPGLVIVQDVTGKDTT